MAASVSFGSRGHFGDTGLQRGFAAAWCRTMAVVAAALSIMADAQISRVTACRAGSKRVSCLKHLGVCRPGQASGFLRKSLWGGRMGAGTGLDAGKSQAAFVAR